MPNLTPNQLRATRRAIQSAARELSRFAAENQLSDEEFAAVSGAAGELLGQSAKLGAMSIHGTSQELSEAAEGLQKASKIAVKTLKTLANVKKALAVASALAGLAGAALTGNPKAIIAAAKDAIGVIGA
ncbi:MAG: hypothetical protein ACT4NX_10215 [Deltaproteobacteria bacterium]